MDELSFVRDLAVILISAGVCTIISRALKQPLVLGYIIAGFLIGPNFDFFFNISSQETVHQWSEIGIIFMMFGLGLEFSFKKLMKAGSTALVTAGTNFTGLFLLGFLTGQAMSWTSMESIFLGGLLSMCSTAVVIKTYDEMGLKNKPYAPMVFGTLVVDDLIAILMMVLLSTMAVSNKFAGGELLFNLGKLLFFIILWFLVGIYLLPTLLEKTREILLIVSIGLCFLMVAIALGVGFSSALGAFVMGSLLAETIESEHIAEIVSPIKDLFGAIFFISVGMMVSPAVIAQNWPVILILALIVLVCPVIFATTGVVVTGGGLENGIHTGFSLAQLGEFGFILAGVGVSLGVMRDFIYPVIIAVSVLTTFTAPYMVRAATPFYAMLQRKLPPSWLAKIASIEHNPNLKSTAEKSEWKKVLQNYFLRLLVYGVILVAIAIGSRTYLEPFVYRVFPQWSEFVHDLVMALSTLVAMSPFIYGLSVSNGDAMNASVPKLLKEKESNIWPVTGLMLLRIFLGIGVVLGVISTYFNLAGWTLLLIAAASAAFFFFAKSTFKKYSAMEKHFFDNLNRKEEMQKRLRPVTSSIQDKLEGYDIHIETITLPQESTFAGKKIEDLHIRLETGANVVKIKRGSNSVLTPWGDDEVYPGDILIAVGTTAQIEALKAKVKASVVLDSGDDVRFNVQAVTLDENSYLTGQTLRTAKLRDYHCMVISMLRGDNFITNPKPDDKFLRGDVVWLAGEQESIDWLRR